MLAKDPVKPKVNFLLNSSEGPRRDESKFCENACEGPRRANEN